MGVSQLWNILDPVKRTGSLFSLNGKTLCVDLSVWICEAHGAKGLKLNVMKPHLRNLFFRVWNLIRAGVKLVFVVDGEPPKVKWEAILRRTLAKNGFGAGRGKVASGPRKKVGRSNFRVWVNECIALLKLLGVPYVESAGEAEALCAWLNAKGIVDGCITNDGDVFLYGGQTVYKDLSINTKECSMACYSMQDIETQLGLTRQNLISLAILLGCDYLPQGVPGVGKEMGLQLIQELNGINLLERFNQWTTFQITDNEMSKIERSVKKKALKIPGFPNREVISEFLSPKLKTQQVSIPQGYSCPDLKGVQTFCLKYLEWPEEYTAEKALSLMAYWQMNRPQEVKRNVMIFPERIVKARVQNRVECYEILWRNKNVGKICPSTFSTIENKQMIDITYPNIVEEFEVTQIKSKSKRQGKRKGKKSVDDVCNHEDSLDNLCEDLNTLSLKLPIETTLPTKKSILPSSCHQRYSRKETSNGTEKQDAIVGNVLTGEVDGNMEALSSDSFEIPLPLSERLAKKKHLLGNDGKWSVDEKRSTVTDGDEFDSRVDASDGLSSLSLVHLLVSEKLTQEKSVLNQVDKCEDNRKGVDKKLSPLTSLEIPVHLSETIPQDNYCMSNPVVKSEDNRKQCIGLNFNVSNGINKQGSLSNSIEVTLPLYERVGKKDSKLENTKESEMDKKRCSKIDINKACNSSSDLFQIPTLTEAFAPGMKSVSGKVEEQKVNENDLKNRDKTENCIDKSQCSDSRLCSRFSMKFEENNHFKKKPEPKMFELCKVDGKSSKQIPGIANDLHVSRAIVPGNDQSEDSNTSKHSCKARKKISNTKGKTKVVYSVEFSSSDDDNDSWFLGSVKESTNMLSSPPKLQSEERLTIQTKINTGGHGKQSHKMKENVQKSMRRSAYGCLEVSTANVDVSIGAVVKIKGSTDFNGNARNNEESIALLSTPIIREVKPLSSNMSKKPVHKPVKQEIQVKDTKPKYCNDDVFKDDTEVETNYLKDHSLFVVKKLDENTNSNKMEKTSFRKDNKEERKENQVDSPLFIPLPLSERLRILRKTQSNSLNAQRHLSTLKD